MVLVIDRGRDLAGAGAEAGVRKDSAGAGAGAGDCIHTPVEVKRLWRGARNMFFQLWNAYRSIWLKKIK